MMDRHDRDDMADERLHSTANVEHIEAPITVKAYLMCAFAAFGGFFFGFVSRASRTLPLNHWRASETNMPF